MKVFFDTNVILDALTNRYDNNFDTRKLINYVASGKIKGYLSTSQVTDIYYCLRKYISDENQKRQLINLLSSTFILIPPLQSNINHSLNSEIDDYEDALIDDVSKINCVDYLVTNNIKDFKKSRAVVLLPKDLLILIENEA